MFVIGFPFLPYPIQPRDTTIICCYNPYTKPSQSNLLSSYIQIKILFRSNTAPIKKAVSSRSASLSKLDNTINKNSIFNTKYAELVTYYKICDKIVGAYSFSQLYFHIWPPLHCPPEICSSTSVNVDFPISLLLVQKIIFTIPANTLFPYNSAIFYLPIFAHNHPNNLHQKCFLYLKHLANSGCRSDTV